MALCLSSHQDDILHSGDTNRSSMMQAPGGGGQVASWVSQTSQPSLHVTGPPSLTDSMLLSDEARVATPLKSLEESASDSTSQLDSSLISSSSLNSSVTDSMPEEFTVSSLTESFPALNLSETAGNRETVEERIFRELGITPNINALYQQQSVDLGRANRELNTSGTDARDSYVSMDDPLTETPSAVNYMTCLREGSLPNTVVSTRSARVLLTQQPASDVQQKEDETDRDHSLRSRAKLELVLPHMPGRQTQQPASEHQLHLTTHDTYWPQHIPAASITNPHPPPYAQVMNTKQDNILASTSSLHIESHIEIHTFDRQLNHLLSSSGSPSSPSPVVPRQPPPSNFGTPPVNKDARFIFHGLSKFLNSGRLSLFFEYCGKCEPLMARDADVHFAVRYLESCGHMYRADAVRCRRAVQDALRVVPRTSAPGKFTVDILAIKSWLDLSRSRLDHADAALTSALQTYHQDKVLCSGKAPGWIHIQDARRAQAEMSGSAGGDDEYLRDDAVTSYKLALQQFEKETVHGFSDEGVYGWVWAALRLTSVLLCCDERMLLRTSSFGTGDDCRVTHEEHVQVLELLVRVLGAGRRHLSLHAAGLRLALTDYCLVFADLDVADRYAQDARTAAADKEGQAFATARYDFIQKKRVQRNKLVEAVQHVEGFVPYYTDLSEQECLAIRSALIRRLRHLKYGERLTDQLPEARHNDFYWEQYMVPGVNIKENTSLEPLPGCEEMDVHKAAEQDMLKVLSFTDGDDANSRSLKADNSDCSLKYAIPCTSLDENDTFYKGTVDEQGEGKRAEGQVGSVHGLSVEVPQSPTRLCMDRS